MFDNWALTQNKLEMYDLSLFWLVFVKIKSSQSSKITDPPICISMLIPGYQTSKHDSLAYRGTNTYKYWEIFPLNSFHVYTSTNHEQ